MKNHETLNKIASNQSGARSDFLYGNILDQKRYIYALNFVHGKKVLDCACGVGWGANLMANAGAQKVVGLDVSEDAISTANKYYSEKRVFYQCATPSQIDASDKFDVITTFETIEHVEDPLEFLISLKKLSHHETVCLLSTPNAYCFKREDDKPYNHYHFMEYTKNDLLVLFNNSGWLVDEYRGQHPINSNSNMVIEYRRFIKTYWKESMRADRYGIAYKVLKKISRTFFSKPLKEPAHLSDCNPVVIEAGFQPAYHFFTLKPSVENCG